MVEAIVTRNGGSLDEDWFVDTSSSEFRGESCKGSTTCIKPTHRIWSTKMGRALTVREMANVQGIWPVDMANPSAFEALLSSPKLAQSMIGNGFTTTMAQAQLIAILVHSQGIRQRLSSSNPSDDDQHPTDTSTDTGATKKRKRTPADTDGAASMRACMNTLYTCMYICTCMFVW